jgi:UPF0755 protein
MPTLERLAQAFTLSIAVATILGAFGGLLWNVGGLVLGTGDWSLTLCELSSPDDVVLSAYLEAHADQLKRPAGTDDTPVTFVVQPGETAGVIADRLARQDLISDAELFRRYVQHHGLDAGIEAGEFTLRQTMTIPEVARTLQEARRPEQIVTVREGLRLEQVATDVAQQTTIGEDAIRQLTTSGWRDRPYASAYLSVVPDGATLEGFLYPDTYRLPEEATADDLVERMLDTFDERVTPGIGAAARQQGLSLYELVTLASIVEREAVVDEERPIIAGVFLNRLRAEWTLDACPTVQYALGSAENWWPPFTLDATDAPSPYNTYQHRGLPPGPICSPGLASIKAAAQPADTDYFFFLADCTKGDGSHLFAETEAEHYANYARCGGQVP